MEADWEIEIGADAPVIDACWAGLVDLRSAPERVHELSETHALPGLAEALVQLNAEDSSVSTSKCDVWPVEDPVDPYELDADTAGTAAAFACYVDILPRVAEQWKEPESAASACRALVKRLHAVPLKACRADLVVRLAQIAPGVQTLGITAYLTACGADEAAARTRLSSAVAVFADTIAAAFPTEGKSSVQ